MSHYNRPGTRQPAVATRERLHKAPCIEDNYVGTAQKQKQPSATAGLDNNVQVTIKVGEPFVIVVRGIVAVPFVTGAVRGSTVWINATNDALTLTDPGGGNGHKFGRVQAIPGQQACPAGFMRVNLDEKGGF